MHSELLCKTTALALQICTKLQEVRLSLPANTKLSSSFMFHSPVSFGSFCQVIRTKMDAYSYAWNATTLRNANVGRYCSIAHNVEIGVPLHSDDVLSTSLSFTRHSLFSGYSGPIERLDPKVLACHDDSETVTIGHDVWVGTRVHIAGGVTIGTGAVIGTGSYITKDVPPYAIVAGRDDLGKSIIKRYRHSDEDIADLLESKWWEYDVPRIMSKLQHTEHRIPINEVKDFLAFMRDSDTSTWPRFDPYWYCLEIQDATHATLNKVSPDHDLGVRYPEATA